MKLLTVVNEKQNYVEDEENGEESVEVHVKGIAPLHVLVSARWSHHPPICDKPAILTILTLEKKVLLHIFFQKHKRLIGINLVPTKLIY